MKIRIKNMINKIKLNIRRVCRLLSLKLIKLLPMKVKNVMKPRDNVKIKIIIINKFLFNNANII